MPNWLVQFIIAEIMKLLTPEKLEALSAAAKQFVVCELKRVVETTSTPIDDAVLQAVAAALGVDLSKCPA